jgi:hypothetical protein
MPHTPVDEMRRGRAKYLRRTMTHAETLEDVVVAISQTAVQAAPPSLTLPRKGGGNTSDDGAR